MVGAALRARHSKCRQLAEGLLEQLNWQQLGDHSHKRAYIGVSISEHRSHDYVCSWDIYHFHEAGNTAASLQCDRNPLSFSRFWFFHDDSLLLHDIFHWRPYNRSHSDFLSWQQSDDFHWNIGNHCQPKDHSASEKPPQSSVSCSHRRYFCDNLSSIEKRNHRLDARSQCSYSHNDNCECLDSDKCSTSVFLCRSKYLIHDNVLFSCYYLPWGYSDY